MSSEDNSTKAPPKGVQKLIDLGLMYYGEASLEGKFSVLLDARGVAYVDVSAGLELSGFTKKATALALSANGVATSINPHSVVMSDLSDTLFLNTKLTEKAAGGLLKSSNEVLGLVNCQGGMHIDDDILHAYLNQIWVMASVRDTVTDIKRRGMGFYLTQISKMIGDNRYDRPVDALVHAMATNAAVITLMNRNNNVRDVMTEARKVAEDTTQSSKGFVHIFLELATGRKHTEKTAAAFSEILALHVSHGDNLSESAARSVASGLGSIVQSLLSGANALYTPRHGFASDAVVEFHSQMKGMTKEEKEKFLSSQPQGFGFPGEGHRVIKDDDDVRFTHIMSLLERCFPEEHARVKEDADLIQAEVEKRKGFLMPRNIDMATGAFWMALGFNVSIKGLSTMLFNEARNLGYVLAHDVGSKQPIIRPADCYVGEVPRDELLEGDVLKPDK